MPFSKYNRAHIVFMIVGFACFGITAEVFFTAFYGLFSQSPLCGKAPAALAGVSYVWMAFIYGLIPVFGILFHDKAKPLAVWLRLPLYALIIYLIEFTTGYLLQLFTGKCPWHYTSGWNVMGLIRLDYFPVWLVFAWLIEQIYVFMNTRVRNIAGKNTRSPLSCPEYYKPLLITGFRAKILESRQQPSAQPVSVLTLTSYF